MAHKKVQQSIFNLLQSEPFYAHFIMNSRVMYDAYKVPTAGVATINGIPLLIFNSEFIKKLTQDEVTGVLKHEILHMVFDHLQTTKDEKRDPKISNIAQDCSINQYIPEINKDPYVTVDSLSKLVGYKLDTFQTSDYYYSHLIKKAKEIEASGMGPMDEHGVEVPGADSKEVARGAVKKAAQNATRQSAGNVPDHIQSVLNQMGEAKLPWKQLLRNAVMSQVSRKTKATTKKINRRFALPVPGKKHKREMTLGVCFDESGSVSNEQLQMFFDETKSISKMITKTWLIHADSEVAEVEDLSKVKLVAQRKAGGGTAYQPALTKCKELKCDMIVYFGDMDAFDVPMNPGIPVLWVVVGSQNPPGDFGRVIRL